MQDAASPKSSVDAPPDQGAPDIGDFNFSKPLQSFTSVKPSFTLMGSVERKLAGTSERKLADLSERKLADVSERKLISLLFAFQIEGDLTALDLQHSRAREIRNQQDDLWKATCFEIFLSRPGDASYLEFNFSPTGDFAVYKFDDYRLGMQALRPVSSPRFKIERGSDFYRITGSIGEAHDDPRLALLLAEPALEASITAVLKPLSGQGDTTFWALSHAGDKADFHLRSSFTFSLREF